MASPNRILVIMPFKLGDMMLCTPTMTGVKSVDPTCHLTLWTQEGNQAIFEHNPSVDEIAYMPMKLPFEKILSTAARIRRERHNIVLMPHGSMGNYVVATYLSGAPIRVACSERWYAKLETHNTYRNWEEDPIHVVRRFMLTAEEALQTSFPDLPMVLNYPDEYHRKAEALLAERGLVPGEFVTIHPGTGGSAIPWAVDRYAAVARAVLANTDLKVLVTGGPTEVALADEMQRLAPGTESVAGKTDLYTMAAVLRRALCSVSGGTGVLHVAASQGTGSVLIEPTPPAEIRTYQWSPWMVPWRGAWSEILCERCSILDCDRTGGRCIEGISVEHVFYQLLELIEEAKVQKMAGRPSPSSPK